MSNFPQPNSLNIREKNNSNIPHHNQNNLRACYFLNPPYVEHCAIHFLNNKTVCPRPGIEFEIFESIFRYYPYELIPTNFTLELIENYSVEGVFKNEPYFNCDVVLSGEWSAPVAHLHQEVHALYPHMQMRTLIAIPANLNASLAHSIHTLLSAYSTQVWLAWLASALMLTFSVLVVNYREAQRSSERDLITFWEYLRALVPGQSEALPVPSKYRHRLPHIMFLFFFGNLIFALYGNCLAVQLHKPEVDHDVDRLEHLFDIVRDGSLTFIDTYDWSESYDMNSNWATFELRQTLLENPIHVASSTEEMVRLLGETGQYIYLGYELNVIDTLSQHNLCESRDWIMVNADFLESGGWYSYVLKKSARVDLKALNEQVTHAQMAIVGTVEEFRNNHKCKRARMDSDATLAPLNFSHIEGCLLILAIGILAGLAMFLWEMANQWKKEKNRTIDNEDALEDSVTRTRMRLVRSRSSYR